jgi:hypothetical protein
MAYIRIYHAISFETLEQLVACQERAALGEVV